MEIGKMLKQARGKTSYTQEDVADKLRVSRQTISNWENEKSYPDIINVIELSNLYNVSLDDLLKGDEKMIEHLQESTNVVKSNKRLITMIVWNIIMMILLIIFNGVISENKYLLFFGLSIAITSIITLFYQIIRKF
ncbi:MAG: helix-turn-helix transcriptional regulator [Coprobacillus sp.]